MGLKPYVAYEASAGSGKTFTLSVRYVSLLFYDIRPEKILALTFTKKAANEMKQRIVEVLTHLEQKEAELNAICEATSLSKEEILKQKPLILARFLRSEHKIMTIDSFLNLIVRNFSLYAGLAPDFSIGKLHDVLLESAFLKRAKAAGLWESLIWLALHENKKMGDIFSLFGFLYTKDLELPEIKPAEGQASFAIEAKLFAEMERFGGLIEACPQASDSLKSMVRNDSIDALAKRAWSDRDTLNYKGSRFNKCYSEALDEALHRMQEGLGDFYGVRESEILARLMELYAVYKATAQELKKSQATLDFDDLTNITARLLEGIDADFLYFRLDGKLEHLLIDEFQDTSIAQYRIMRPIIEEIRSGIGTSDAIKSFFYVGDVKQSIYRFRGGNADLFGYVRGAHDVELEYLDTNYRSSRSVVEFVNETFREAIAGYHPQKVREGAATGYCSVDMCDEPLPELIKTIHAMKSAGIGYEEMAVLTFTNDDVVTVKAALQEAFGDIPIVTDSSKKLTSQKEVRALIELVKYLYFGAKIFLHNFYALREGQPAVDPKAYQKLMQAPFITLLHRLIGDLGLFNDDPNLLRFMEECRRFKDAEAFIYGYELLDAPMLRGSYEGLRILTIHKSKGLEFEHTVVLDRLKRANNRSDTLIFNYEGITLKEIAYRFANREKFDPYYRKLKENEAAMADKDLLNTLYVAFTRAKRSLFVIGKEKGSAFEALGLACGSRGVLEPSASPVAPAKSKPAPLVYEDGNYGRQELPLKKEKAQEDFDFDAVDLGSALHYALEMLGGFKTEGLGDAMTAVKNRFLLEPEGYADVEAMVKLLVGDSTFLALVEGECFKERSFFYEGELGVIDLYIIDKDVVRVIDYKTGRRRPEYDQQIARYKAALEHLYPGKRVEGYLCFVDMENVRIEAL